ncbi:hypothetical protein ACFLZN_00520 [Nanoarchaeota archaeon]
MNKPIRVILLDSAKMEYARLNELVGRQVKEEKKTLVRCNY